MRITKYPQSCLLLEKNGRSIVIDPGNLVLPKFDIKNFAGVEAVLVTHQHADHLDDVFLKQLVDAGAKVYSNADVAQKLSGTAVTVITSGESVEILGFNVTAHDLPHVKTFEPEPPQNTGFIIDGTFFHSGDGLETSGVEVETCAIPIIGPSNSFVQAYNFATSLNAKNVVPLHFDGAYQGDPNVFKERAADLNVIVLPNGESTQI